MGGMGINSIEALRGNRLMLRGIGLTDRELAVLGRPGMPANEKMLERQRRKRVY